MSQENLIGTTCDDDLGTIVETNTETLGKDNINTNTLGDDNINDLDTTTKGEDITTPPKKKITDYFDYFVAKRFNGSNIRK